MSRLILPCVLLSALLLAACQPAPVTFYHTQDSDDWVRHELVVQPAYTRVLLVSRDADPPKTITAAPPDLNAREGDPQPEHPGARAYRVDRVFKTLQEAADESRGGDLVAVTPGIYAGFTINGARPGAGDGRYIHFKALGWPGAVIIDRPPATENQAWFILLTSTHHIIIEGFNLDGRAYANVPTVGPATQPAEEHAPDFYFTPVAPDGPVARAANATDVQPDNPGAAPVPSPAPLLATRPAPRRDSGEPGPTTRPRRAAVDWAGIMLGSGFGVTGQLTHHVIILNNFSHHHGKWGLHATDTHTVLLQGNLFAFSREEHSCYVSNGSHNYVIRRNIFFGSNGCALHCNIDATSCVHDTLGHPAMRGFPANDGSAAWMQAFLKEATRQFGVNGFPDGRGINFIIEENVMNRNGVRNGGAGINLGSVQESLIQNNLIYDEWHHGIALYNNFERSDRALTSRAHPNPQQITGPEVLPFFGAHDNLIRNNTVMVNAPGYAANVVVNGSYRSTFRNNIFLNDADDSIHIDSHSLWRYDSGYNVAGRVGFSMVDPHGYWTDRVKEKPTFLPPEFKSLATHLDENYHSALGVTQAQLAPQFVGFSHEPWVIFEGSWWKLNPNRPDFHPRADSKLLAGMGDGAQVPQRDLEGQVRGAVGRTRVVETQPASVARPGTDPGANPGAAGRRWVWEPGADIGAYRAVAPPPDRP